MDDLRESLIEVNDNGLLVPGGIIFLALPVSGREAVSLGWDYYNGTSLRFLEAFDYNGYHIMKFTFDRS